MQRTHRCAGVFCFLAKSGKSIAPEDGGGKEELILSHSLLPVDRLSGIDFIVG